MSHYSKIETQIVDRESLLKALNELGYTTVEVHPMPQNLYGYQGDVRAERAEVIIRRQFISNLSNDIGFKLTDSGTYEAIVSEYDQQLLGENWLDNVCQKYAEFAVVTKLEMQGFSIAERKIDPVTKRVHLVLRRCG